MANGYEEDASYLQIIFPNELWDMILDSVREEEDYHRISSASPHFRTSLLRKAPTILFPQVLEILVEHENKLCVNQEWHVTRKVCQAWKRGMDEILQTQEYFTRQGNERIWRMDGMRVAVDNHPDLEGKLLGIDPEVFPSFEKHFDPTHLLSRANPFMSRKIEFIISYTNGPLEPFYPACLQFLQKYGHQIWFFAILFRFQDDAYFVDFFDQKLPSIVQLLPNLRGLQIKNNGGFMTDSFSSEGRASFPTLPHLEHISFQEVPVPTVKKLVESNPQVKYVNAMIPGYTPLSGFVLESLPDLRELALAVSFRDEIEELQQARFTSRVECLWLAREDVDVPLEEVLRALEIHFSKSLVELQVSLTTEDNIGAEFRLRLPQLKIFHLEMYSAQPLDFLLPLKDTLEELHLALEQEPVPESFEGSETQRQNLQMYYTFWEEPHKSDIWSTFPQLQLLVTKVFALDEQLQCTRREWRDYVKAENTHKNIH